MPVYIYDIDRRSKPRRVRPNSQTIYDHFTHKEMGENKQGWTPAIFRTAETFDISPVDVENALIDISLLQRKVGQIH